MRRAHRRAHGRIWPLLAGVMALVIALALLARPPAGAGTLAPMPSEAGRALV
jgi:uncharacterized membrane protein HdeD (DUF308 family)